ncbi:MAG TPA: cadmium-translocating P-type ATPase [Candidatus Fournierella merdigallinarum]|nr:cadmium-translocating P-type ATPase [Candidatus Fournierella merdigallinarum]
MNRKQKRALGRILAAAALFAASWLPALPDPARLALQGAAYLLVGFDVLQKAALGVAHGQVFDENFLMGVATLGALALGRWEESVEVMLFYQVGELFQSCAVGKSRRSIAALMDIRPDAANLERDGGVETVDPEQVAVGDVILIRPGERVPLDGRVLEGVSSLNTSALTGESLPRDVQPGDEVISGCVNEGGLLRVEVTRPFGQSTVSRILELVEDSAMKKARAENFITRFARWYTPAVCLAALALAVLPPLFLGGWAEWVRRALTFLVISCPCALVISVPLSFFGGIGGASRAGILVKGGTDLEGLAAAGTVVFDKTGTLTRGVFEVSEVLPADGVSARQLLETAALAEQFSSHPIAVSLRRAAGVEPAPGRVKEVAEAAGHGVTALVDGVPVAVGGARLMERLGVDFVPAAGAGSAVYVAVNGAFAGSVLISDRPKPTAKGAVESLRRAGVRTVMLTGDSEAAARAMAGELGIDEVRAGLLPGDKVACVEALLAQKRPRTTLVFVGDGINDAPVLTRADVGVAMGAMGSDAAIEAADVVLMDDDPAKLWLAIRAARRCLAVVRQNILFTLGVKGACLALGAAGLVGMQAAIFADVGVMVLAVLNAMRTLHAARE